MASETLRLTAQIVMSHASLTELTPSELVDEIKQVYTILASLEVEGVSEAALLEKGQKPGEVKKPPQGSRAPGPGPFGPRSRPQDLTNRPVGLGSLTPTGKFGLVGKNWSGSLLIC